MNSGKKLTRRIMRIALLGITIISLSSCRHHVLGDGYFVCYEVDQPGIEHGDSRRHAVCNLEVEYHAFLAGEAVDERVVVAHRFVAIEEVRCRAV